MRMEKTLGDLLLGTLSESLLHKGAQIENHCLCCGKAIPPGFDFCAEYSIFNKDKEGK